MTHEQKAWQLIQQNNGVTREQVQQHLGLKIDRTKLALAKLRRQGLADFVFVSSELCLWFPADVAKDRREQEQARMIEARRQKNRERMAEIRAMELDESIDSWPVRRSYVKAIEAEPLKKQGPASVWELAA